MSMSATPAAIPFGCPSSNRTTRRALLRPGELAALLAVVPKTVTYRR